MKNNLKNKIEIIDIALLRPRLEKIYRCFFSDTLEPVTFGEAYGLLLLFSLEKLIYGYSTMEQRLLSFFSTPELNLSDTDALLELSLQEIKTFLEKTSEERIIDYYGWEISRDQRSIRLFTNLHL